MSDTVYLAVARWDRPEGIDHYRQHAEKEFDTLAAAQAFTLAATDDPEALRTVYSGRYDDEGDWYEDEASWYWDGREWWHS